jgi:hypothetical protein
MGQGIDNWTKTLSLAVTLPILPSHLAPQSRMFGNTDEEVRSMNKQLKRMQAKARELAQSGKFYGWPPLEFELRFEDGF